MHLLEPGQLNTYDVLISDDVVFTEAALAAFVAGPPSGKSAKAVARTRAAEVADDERAADGSRRGTADATEDPIRAGLAPAARRRRRARGLPDQGQRQLEALPRARQPFYKRTIAEVWFKTAEAAEAAGFELPPSQRDTEDEES